MTIDEATVVQIQSVWSNTAPPVRPSKEGLELFRSVLRDSSAEHVLILGATPELVDLSIDEGVRRVTSLELKPEILAGMRRIGERGWKYVETLTGNWLDHRPDFDGAFDAVLCDGGLLFLDFPDSWRALLENIGRYLKMDGCAAVSAYCIPPDAPGFEEYKHDRLSRFDRELVGVDGADITNLYRALAAELLCATFAGAERADGSFDINLIEDRLASTATGLKNRYRDAALHEIVAANFKGVARNHDGKLELRALVPPGLGKPIIEQCGFDVDVIPLPDPPVPAADYVYVARKHERPR